MIEIEPAEFDALVESALDDLPSELASLVSNVVVLVEPEAPPEDPDILGLYDGVALTERPANYAGGLPDRILLFRGPLTEMAQTREELERMRVRAASDIEAEKQRAIADLRAEVADLALAAASVVVGESMTDERQRRLVEEFLSGSVTGGSRN